MRVRNDKNQWVGDGQVVDEHYCHCIDHVRLGPNHREPTPEEIKEHSDALVELVEAARRALQKEQQMVRAKFMLQEVRHHHWNKDSVTLILRPQYDTTIEEDKRFAKATPSGELSMQVDNPPAAAFFELGKTYYLDFTKAE